MKKIVLFLVTVVSFSLGAYFLGASLANNAKPTEPKPNPILESLEQKVSENPDNILEIIAETKKLIGSSSNEFELARARIKLDRAVTTFYKSHLRTIAEKLFIKNGPEGFKKAYDSVTAAELKAEPTIRYRNIVEARMLSGATIDPNTDEFKSYVYIAGKSKSAEAVATGAISKESMRIMLAAEKGIAASTWAILPPTTLKNIFASIGLKPWSDADLRTMRKTILMEWLGIDTKYTKAYVTARIDFKDRKTGRLYLKDTLKHTKQTHNLSCEANSIADLFNFYRGIANKPRTTEAEVFSLLPKDETLPDLIQENGKSIRIWSDPDKVFVWKVRGVQSININKLTGYGIHPKGALPTIQKELATHDRTASIDKFNAFNILWSLYSGEPILFWYVLTDDPKNGFNKIDWRTPSGDMKTGYIGEHTGIIVGAELSKNGDLLKVGYYEWTTTNVIWESYESLERKASYFEWAIYPTKIKQ